MGDYEYLTVPRGGFALYDTGETFVTTNCECERFRAADNARIIACFKYNCAFNRLIVSAIG